MFPEQHNQTTGNKEIFTVCALVQYFLFFHGGPVAKASESAAKIRYLVNLLKKWSVCD